MSDQERLNQWNEDDGPTYDGARMSDMYPLELDEEYEDEEYFEEECTCMCPLCYCHAPVHVPGETCSDCMSGAHQG